MQERALPPEPHHGLELASLQNWEKTLVHRPAGAGRGFLKRRTQVPWGGGRRKETEGPWETTWTTWAVHLPEEVGIFFHRVPSVVGGGLLPGAPIPELAPGPMPWGCRGPDVAGAQQRMYGRWGVVSPSLGGRFLGGVSGCLS